MRGATLAYKAIKPQLLAQLANPATRVQGIESQIAFAARLNFVPEPMKALLKRLRASGEPQQVAIAAWIVAGIAAKRPGLVPFNTADPQTLALFAVAEHLKDGLSPQEAGPVIGFA